jgi:DNA-binding NtrC family response regulator
MASVRILVIDDDEASRKALLCILEAEDWLIDLAALPEDGFAKLRQGGWNLVIANVSMSSLSGPLFSLLRELHVGGASLKVLFLVPAMAEHRVRAEMERWKLIYELKPIHLHDFLEQVSDLLLEAGAIQQPLRRVRMELAAAEHSAGERGSGEERRKTEMFSSRDDYSYDEEELRKFEEEEQKRKKETEPPPPGDLTLG